MAKLEQKIVIVGGGIIGCSTAYYLTKLGHKNVTVFESVDVAHAASGRAGGFLALDWCDGGQSGSLARRSFKLHETLGSELAADSGYRKMQTLSVGLSEKNCPDAKSKQRKCSKPEWVDGNVLSSEVIGTTQTTAQVHPKLLTKAFINAAVKNGANLVKKSVVSGNSVDNVVRGVVLEDSSCIAADVVILCMGPWEDRGLDWFGIGKKLVTGTRAHSITIDIEGKSNIDNTALFLAYKEDPEVYPRPDGTVYVCGSVAAEHAPLPEHPKDVIFDSSACEQIKALAGKVCLELKNAENYSKSACYLPHSADGTPIIGKVPTMSGLYMAAGHSCWGILQGPATGEAVAELVSLGKSSHVDLSPFDPSRFF
eukprot:GFUD01033674.1.p1 GENE.GFUD01033674.1~~GFUD01033674.1.p1  ORF type:complete len:368 (+),score=36.14 GFUD01033674.1:67-1170(+)